MPTRVAIVPHTHWDREWYAPFQAFRMRLVKLLDELLPMLEADLSYARFLLDGQTAVLDDYLEIRPEAAGVLTRLAAAGRLSVGPWMVLMDEFMVSGETMVRDLQFGLTRGAQLGGVMPVGYLPDMFGHVAQMPQLLRLAGLEHAVVWRGVPAQVAHTAFWWEAPDGSRVRAEYLYGSYSNGRDIPDDAKQLVLRARDYEHELGGARLGDMLLMNGTDHQMPQPWLSRVVADANAQQDRYRFVITSLAEYLPRQPTDGLSSVRGELRSGARANLLMGVGSNRVDVHRACAAAERALEKRAEPLSALFTDPDAYPHALTAVAWRNLVLNSAHDSSCACSDDEVVDHVLVRYAEARQIGDGLTHDAVRSLANQVAAPGGATLVVNPTGRSRRGVVDALVPGSGPCHFTGPDGDPLPTQLLGEIGGNGFQTMVTGQKVRWVLDEMRGTEFAGRQIASYEVINAGETHEIVLHEARGGARPVDLAELKEQMLALGEQGRTMTVRVVVAPVRHVLVDTGMVDGFGWATLTAVEGTSPATTVHADDAGWLTNEYLRVTVDPSDGTYTVDTVDGLHVAGLGRLVDGGDGGDTYNYSPPDDDLVVDRPDSVHVHVLEAGPVRARVAIDTTYTWPACALGDERSCSQRSDTTVASEIRTVLELRPEERFLRVTHEIDNHARDHRLRAHFPLPARVAGSDAECAFAVVHRGLTAEGGAHEVGLPTFPSRRFVDASDGRAGMALLHDGLLEYEVVDDGRALALTLLRAVGYLSRTEPQLRPNPAGPPMQLAGPQLLGPQRAQYAVLVHTGDWRAADCYGAADAFLVPFERTRVDARSRATRPARGNALRVHGAEVSAVTRVPGGLLVRVFRTAAGVGPVGIEHEGMPARGFVVDLRGGPGAPFEGSVELRSWEIATLQLSR
ncbi:MAG TPA: glycoside hydrolase family 38 C-terminal domain-containing protein [Acidimicrobiia bacterium]|nr:glycoside hydrolase family 38 C-terminal domain-containing protein [Acidimicrobiia bacterium]